MASTEARMLQLHDATHRAEAVDALVRGEIIVTAFNGIFVLVGDADDASVPGKVAVAKQRPETKGLALVCPPEHLAEHVAVDAAVLRTTYPLAQIRALYRAVHALGVILPAAVPGAPTHIVQSGTVLNVWTEHPPRSPLRHLVRELRQRGRRALAGTSANRSGHPTITESGQVQAAFADRVALFLLDSFEGVPTERRRSSSLVDLTGPNPRLVREGSVPADELGAELGRLGLGKLAVGPDVSRV